MPRGILLGHIVWKQGLSVDLTKIVVIVNFPALKTVRQLPAILGHTSYYKMYIKGYTQITFPMDTLFKKDVTFNGTNNIRRV